MRYYTVVVKANLPQNNGEPEYGQEYRAYDPEDLCVAVSRHNIKWTDGEYPYNVIVKHMIKAECGEFAIMKFKRWQNEGLDHNYLSGDSKEKVMEGSKGCWKCKNLEWFDDDSSDGHPGNEGWGCNKREDVEKFKTFPCNRLLHCFERLEDKSLNVI